MSIKILILVGLGVVLIGCNTEVGVPFEQLKFESKRKLYEEHLKEAQRTNTKLEIERGKLNIRKFLKQDTHTASLWYGEITALDLQSMDYLKVRTRFRAQEYNLVIVDPLVVSHFSMLENGNIIYFSGTLGAEQSVTVANSIKYPQFTLIPSLVVVGPDRHPLVQSLEAIEHHKMKVVNKVLKSRVKARVNTECKDKTSNLLINFDEIRFSKSEQHIIEASRKKWIYRNSVKTKNPSSGQTIEFNIHCVVAVTLNEDNTSFFVTKTHVNLDELN